MAASRLPMRKHRDVLRLKCESQLPLRAIAQASGLGLGTSARICRAPLPPV